VGFGGALTAGAAKQPTQKWHTHSRHKPEQSSLHRGVAWSKGRGKWRAQIVVDKKRRHLGYFAEEVEAAAAYSEAAVAKAKGQPYMPAREIPEQSSQHRGVHWHKGSGKWQAAIGVDGKLRHLGRFAEEAEAAAAYTNAAVARAKAKGQPLPA
jgi:hypothetical protein